MIVILSCFIKFRNGHILVLEAMDCWKQNSAKPTRCSRDQGALPCFHKHGNEIGNTSSRTSADTQMILTREMVNEARLA